MHGVHPGHLGDRLLNRDGRAVDRARHRRRGRHRAGADCATGRAGTGRQGAGAAAGRPGFGGVCPGQTTFGGGQHEQAGNHPTKHQVMDHAVRPSRPKRRNQTPTVDVDRQPRVAFRNGRCDGGDGLAVGRAGSDDGTCGIFLAGGRVVWGDGRRCGPRDRYAWTVRISRLDDAGHSLDVCRHESSFAPCPLVHRIRHRAGWVNAGYGHDCDEHAAE